MLRSQQHAAHGVGECDVLLVPLYLHGGEPLLHGQRTTGQQKSTHHMNKSDNDRYLYCTLEFLYCKSNQQTDDDDSIARVRKTKHDVQIVVSIM